MHSELVKSDVAAGATNTIRPLTHSSDLSREGLAVNATHEPPASGTWRTIPSFPDYLASTDGRIFSKRRWSDCGTYRRQIGGMMMTLTSHPYGYLKVQVTGPGGNRRYISVHTLIAETFLGPRPPGAVIRHLNDIPTDNRVSNLAYGTPRENNLDAVKNGRNANALKTHCPQGHAYTPENTNFCRRKNGDHFRQCAECKRLRDARLHAKCHTTNACLELADTFTREDHS